MRRALAAAVLVLAALTARGDDRKALAAYEAGMKAVQAGQWQAGVQQLQAALAERGDEGSFKVGVAVKEFVPSRWLAEAHLGLGDCAKASSSLGRARAAKMGPKERAGLDALAARIAACGGAPAAASAAPAAASAPAAAAACPQLAAARAALRDGDDARARRLAQECLAAQSGDAGAREIVESVDATLSGKILQARKQQGAGDVQAALLLAREVLAVDAGNADALALERKLAVQVAALPSAPVAASAARASAPALASAARATSPVASASAPAASAPAASSAPSATTSGGPLPAGVASYFRGDIEAAISALQGGTPSAQTRAVLACALATRSLLASDPQAARDDVEKARAAWQEAKALRADLSLEATWVSPRVRDALR